MKTKRLYAEIAKVEDNEDGTITVEGYASSGAVDSDGETITPEAMKAAIPDYMKFGAVREMHQPMAAGTAISADVEADGRTAFKAMVVDDAAIKKVRTGVYKGFSIGGKVTERDPLDKKIIKGLNLIEISLVDRPANPEALLSCYKAERSDEDDVAELAELLDAGTVTPARVLELIKGAQAAPVAAAASAAADPAAAPAPAEVVTKSLWNVADFASLLNSLGYLASDSEWEAQAEGDASPVPGQLRDWLKQGIEIFKAMAAEEAAELVARLQAMVPEDAVVLDVIVAAASVGDLAKAGARFSKATKEALGNAHTAMKTACDHMDKLNYAAKDDDDSDKAAHAESLAKAAALATAHDVLVKACGAAGCPEGEAAAVWISKVATERASFAKRVAELEAKPAAGKALLKVLGKGQDYDPAAASKASSAVAALPENASGEEVAKAQLVDIFRSGGVQKA